MTHFPLVDPPAGHILARVRMATICGSDLHSVSGRRLEPAPSILGHEIVAEIVELGEGVTDAASGARLEQGDRVTFTIMAYCGNCENCRAGLPQKCESLFKYGHTRIHDGLPLSGGYAEYVYLRPGTAIFHVPTELSDKEICPANCALATVINGLETIEVNAGDRVLVQGSGLLGIYCTMLLKERGASEVVVTDVADGRLDAATRLGADEALNVTGMDDEKLISALGKSRFDCVVQVCGNPSVVWPGIQMLRLRGRYLIMGLLSAGSNFTVDADTVARHYLTIKGTHNYAPRHLASGLDFLVRARSKLDFDSLVGAVMPLSDINHAFDEAATRSAVRVAIVP
jgi:putative phosphonate catabolism associated alcohol dehydrogenase